MSDSTGYGIALIIGFFIMLAVILLPKPITNITTVLNMTNVTYNTTNNITGSLSGVSNSTGLPNSVTYWPTNDTISGNSNLTWNQETLFVNGKLNLTNRIYLPINTQICLIENCSRYIMANSSGILIQG